MSDAQARAIDRARRANLDPQDGARAIASRLRTGELTRELVELAAYLGCADAFPALGVLAADGMTWTFPARSNPDAGTITAVTAATVPPGKDPPLIAWTDGLDRWRPSLCPDPWTHQLAARAHVWGAAMVTRRMGVGWRRLHVWANKMGTWPAVGSHGWAPAIDIQAPETVARAAESWDPAGLPAELLPTAELLPPLSAGPDWLSAPLRLARLDVEPGPLLRGVVRSIDLPSGYARQNDPMRMDASTADVLTWFRAGALRSLGLS